LEQLASEQLVLEQLASEQLVLEQLASEQLVLEQLASALDRTRRLMYMFSILLALIGFL
jgi:hypothetical protein